MIGIVAAGQGGRAGWATCGNRRLLGPNSLAEGVSKKMNVLVSLNSSLFRSLTATLTEPKQPQTNTTLMFFGPSIQIRKAHKLLHLKMHDTQSHPEGSRQTPLFMAIYSVYHSSHSSRLSMLPLPAGNVRI